jgi:hypothetical protein
MELFKNKRGKLEMKLDTTEDRIAAYMMGKIDEDKLQKPDQKIMRRWAKIWSLMENAHSPSQAVKTMVRIYKRGGEDISERTVWNDLDHATRIWGNLQDVSYKATLILLKEYAMKTFQMAAQDRDKKEMNRAISEMKEISRELYLISDADKDDSHEKSNFILVVNQSDGGRTTIDLTDYEVLPDDMANNIIDAFQTNQNSTDNFLKIVEEGGNIDEE